MSNLKLFKLVSAISLSPTRRLLPIIAAALMGLIGIAPAEEALADNVSSAPNIEKFTTDELHKLVAPVALYPDALLAQVLPASTYPIQIVEAYRYTQTAEHAENPPENCTWDSSVIALLHYPPVLKKMNDDLTWTEQLGMAVTYQMADVTAAIQQVRAEAQAAGNLKTNDKQNVIVEREVIQIVPASPDTIYVPIYDPGWICEPYDLGPPPFIWGGFGFGLWLGNEFDWRHHQIWIHHRWHNGYWYSSSYPAYWRPPIRPIPSWYLKSNVAKSGLAVKPKGDALAKTVVPKLDRVHPMGMLSSKELHANSVTPKSITVPKNSLGSDGMESTGSQTRKERERGQNSRENIVRPPVTPTVPATPRVPVTPHYTPPSPPRSSYHEEIQHYSDRSTTQSWSNRGADSRGSSLSGGGRRR
ncbi:MAG TPA: DUF3300 domain-containing protein [Planctomycetota bacterium]|nr:DUF3300 domain-containing protein [Planctomycetota bacterium]